MSKIPVGQTIADSYGFAFRRYFPILGVVWLPFLLIGAAAYYVFFPALTLLLTFIRDAALFRQYHPQGAYLPPSFWVAIRGMFSFEFLAIVILTVIAVGVTKEALQTRRGPWFVYLSIGKSELLILGGLLTLVALYFGALIAFGVVGGIVGLVVGFAVAGMSGTHADPASTVATTVIVVRVAIWLIFLVIAYCFVRLSFLLVPISTAEGRFGVWRSWQLTKGNFWRIVAIALATFLPVMIVSYGVWFVAFGPDLFRYMWNGQVHPELAASQFPLLMQLFISHALTIGIYGFIFAPISYGLMFGQSAFAYRALTNESHD